MGRVLAAIVGARRAVAMSAMIPVAIFRERRHIAPTHALARHARLIRLARTRHIHAILANYPRALGRALRLAGPRFCMKFTILWILSYKKRIIGERLACCASRFIDFFCANW